MAHFTKYKALNVNKNFGNPLKLTQVFLWIQWIHYLLYGNLG